MYCTEKDLDWEIYPFDEKEKLDVMSAAEKAKHLAVSGYISINKYTLQISMNYSNLKIDAALALQLASGLKHAAAISKELAINHKEKTNAKRDFSKLIWKKEK